MTTSDPAELRPSPFSGPGTLYQRFMGILWQGSTLTVSLKLLILAAAGAITFQGDFNGDLYLGGLRILHGISPYQPATLAHQAAIIAAGGTIHVISFPRYPAPMLLLAAPLSLLPLHVAGILFMIINVGAVLGGLRLLGVRDPRCVLVAMVSIPVITGLFLGNVSALLLLGAAAAWRVSEQHRASAVVVACTVVAKVFMWPLGIWLLIRRGRSSFLLSFIIGVVIVAVGWAVIGFHGLLQYPGMLINMATIAEHRGCSLAALLMYFGLGSQPARIMALAGGVSILVLAWRLSRREDGARDAFGMVILAALTATPVVWSHYLVLLFVPIALLSPTLSYLWFLPTLTVFAPYASPHSYGLWVLPGLGAELWLGLLLCAPLLPSRSWAPLLRRSSWLRSALGWPAPAPPLPQDVRQSPSPLHASL